MELSDVISLHSYLPIEDMVLWLTNLKRLNRPILMTEWMHRIRRSNVREIYPLMYMERIGNYCWGFVLGKTQTNEPWESLWEEYERDPSVGHDFTKWQHDLFRPNLRPYDPKEIEIIKKFCQLADKDFEREQAKR